MKNKKAQFYLVSVLILATLFISFVSISNFIGKKNLSFSDLTKEIDIERKNLLDYIVYNNLSQTDSYEKMFNFSKEYISYLGPEKNSFFIFGNTQNLTIIGNKTADTNFSYNVTGSIIEVTNQEISISLSGVNEEVYFYLDNFEYSKKIYPGQNIYYLIKYNYNNEVYILNG